MMEFFFFIIMDVQENEALSLCLFPSYAFKAIKDKESMADSDDWILNVSGWALIEKPDSMRRKLVLGVTKRMFAPSSDDVQEIEQFEQRAKHFLSRPLQSNSIKVFKPFCNSFEFFNEPE